LLSHSYRFTGIVPIDKKVGSISFPEDFIYIAPFPILSGLVRLDDWMSCRIEVLSTMLVDRIIATTYVTTTQAQTKMDPRRTYF
jgi:hypothetical protein